MGSVLATAFADDSVAGRCPSPFGFATNQRRKASAEVKRIFSKSKKAAKPPGSTYVARYTVMLPAVIPAQAGMTHPAASMPA